MSYAGVAMEQGERILKLETENAQLKSIVSKLEATIEAMEDEAIEAGIYQEMSQEDAT
jgi:predicted RNase H-like nuclease (RuvC/YqgF family)